MDRVPLPIDDVLPEIIAAFQQAGRVVIVAPPGAGKTTGIPPALCAAEPAGEKILLLQPRRMAARTVAGRLAQTMKCPLGTRVGYQVRLDRKWTDQSMIVVMTYGVLLRRLQNDPLLEDFGTVLLDEFHERSLESDLALAMLHRIRSELRPSLRLGVMSATLEVQGISQYLDHAPIIESAGHMYPVEIRYADRIAKEKLEEQISQTLVNLLRETPGHVLIFLPGVGEIRRTAQHLEPLATRSSAVILELYGDLPPQQQDRVLMDLGQRKIILATNVAETSITIPGVTAVIDSGLARVLRVDPHVGLPRLDVEPISLAACDQRAGRAGRTARGICSRLWLKEAHRSRRPFDHPEVQRGDLSSAILQLYGWGERDILSFPWLTPPSPEAVEAAVLLLTRLGALEDHRISQLGKEMLRIPAHPRLARLLIEARERGVVRPAAVAAALLSERDPFVDSMTGDLIERVERYLRWIDREDDGSIRGGAAQAVKQTVFHLLDTLRGGGDDEQLCSTPSQSLLLTESPADTTRFPESDLQQSLESNLCRSLLAAFPDRVASRRQGAKDRARMVGGVGIRLRNMPTVESAEYSLCLDLVRKSADAEVRLAVGLREEWLQGRNRSCKDESFFHPTSKRVVGRRRDYWLDLILSETPIEVTDPSLVTAALAAEVATHWKLVFPQDDQELRQTIARVNFLATRFPDLGFSTVSEARLVEIGQKLCAGKQSLEEVRDGRWLDSIREEIGYSVLATLDQWAPASIELPGGNRTKINYADPLQPSISVRLQELFGWTETPRIAQQRYPLLLRILAPNFREVQITQDLGNFWRSTYAQVRKDLRRRYPKHAWPDEAPGFP